MAAAEALLRQSPGMTFVYVSGAGTDSREHGRTTVWARIKGKTDANPAPGRGSASPEQ
jgi:hypothetical protein